MTIASRANHYTQGNEFDLEAIEGNLVEKSVHIITGKDEIASATELAGLLLALQGSLHRGEVLEVINTVNLAVEFCYLATQEHKAAFGAWRDNLYEPRDHAANIEIGKTRGQQTEPSAAQPEAISNLVEQIIAVVTNPLLPSTLQEHFEAGLTQLTNEHAVTTDNNPDLMRAWLPDAIAKENQQEVNEDAK